MGFGVEGPSDPHQAKERYVSLSSFDSSDVVSVHSGPLSETLLRKPRGNAAASHSFPQLAANFLVVHVWTSSRGHGLGSTHHEWHFLLRQ